MGALLMVITSQNDVKTGFFVISGRNRRRIVHAGKPFLKKQSQFISVQRSAFSGQRQDEEKEFEKTKPIFERAN